MKAYLFAYSQAWTQAQVHAILNDTQAIETWVAPFPYAAILTSSLNAQDLGAVLHRRLSDAWFLVTEMNPGSVDGWLPGNLWSYVNQPGQVWSQNPFENLPPPQQTRRDPLAEALLAGDKGR